MPKISELTAITELTDSDIVMVTDAETSASKKIVWSNIKASIDSTGAPLTLESDSGNGARITLSQAEDGTDAPDVQFKKSRGTHDSPTTVTASDALGRFNAFAYNGSAFIQAGNFGFLASDGSGNGTYEVKTRVGGTLAKRIEVDSNGHVDLSGGLTWTPRSSVTPQNNGDLTVEATNDTTLTFKLKGSDGTVRTGTLTLS